jgi:hypothetical protein
MIIDESRIPKGAVRTLIMIADTVRIAELEALLSPATPVTFRATLACLQRVIVSLVAPVGSTEPPQGFQARRGARVARDEVNRVGVTFPVIANNGGLLLGVRLSRPSLITK